MSNPDDDDIIDAEALQSELTEGEVETYRGYMDGEVDE